MKFEEVFFFFFFFSISSNFLHFTNYDLDFRGDLDL